MKQSEFITHADGRGISATLARAIIRRLGGWREFQERARDVTTCGAAGGFAGFIYYSETEPFARRHCADILRMAESMREDFGEPDTLAQFIAGFNCLDIPAARVELALMNCNPDPLEIKLTYNALAWFALEELARAYVDAREDSDG